MAHWGFDSESVPHYTTGLVCTCKTACIELRRVLTQDHVLPFWSDPAKDFEKSFARSIQSDAEISMEADPGTFDRQKLVDYASLGVNRFSIGVQAFQEVGNLIVHLQVLSSLDIGSACLTHTLLHFRPCFQLNCSILEAYLTRNVAMLLSRLTSHSYVTAPTIHCSQLCGISIL